MLSLWFGAGLLGWVVVGVLRVDDILGMDRESFVMEMGERVFVF